MANLTDTTKYLDLTGLGQYDALIKKYSDDNDASILAQLQAAIGEGGDVATQIAAAIAALKGTLAQDDAATLEAINDEINGIDSAIETLNGDNTTAGSVAKAVKDGIDAIGSGSAQGETGKAITSITQTNGVVTASAGNVAAQYVTVDYTPAQAGDDPVSATANVQASLNEIYGLISNNAEAGEVAVYDGNTKVNAINEFGKTYTFKQGNTTIATMNLAKDMVVSGGSVVTATAADKAIDDNVIVGEKYVKLTIANSSDVLYIPVNDLYKDHTAAANAQKIQIAISNNNEISADVVSGSIEETDLTTTLQTKINAAGTTATAKDTGHVTLIFTPASGSTPANIAIAENDIASAQDLSDEVARAQAAEGEIAGKIGLTGAEGSRAYATNVTLGDGVAKTVVNDINTLNSRLGSVETYISNMTAITSQEITALFAVQSSGD